jgi:REP element-mobilizing transposase RayT
MIRDRKHIRLRNYDYASDGWYFVTICTHERECYFGKIESKKMFPSDIGIQAELMWNEIPQHFPMAELGEFVVMPNHIHGIIGIHHKFVDGIVGPPHGVAVPDTNDDIVGTRHGVSQQSPNFNQFGKTIPGSLSAIIGQYKSSVSRWCIKNNRAIFAWQSRFHDHVIRNQEEFDRIENYILNNVANWNSDKFYTE